MPNELGLDTLHFGNACFLTVFQPIVVEPFPVQNLAADCPIFIIFEHSRLYIFHYYVVVYKSLRVFQQFRGIHCNVFTIQRTMSV